MNRCCAPRMPISTSGPAPPWRTTIRLAAWRGVTGRRRSGAASDTPPGLLDRIPAEHLAAAVERLEGVAQRRHRVLADRLRRPALGAVDAAQRPALAHQEDLVVAGGEDLSGHVPRRIGGQEHR